MFTLVAIICCLGLVMGMCVTWTGGELPIGPEIPEVPDDPPPAPKYLVAILPVPAEDAPAPPEDKPGLPEPYEGPVPALDHYQA